MLKYKNYNIIMEYATNIIAGKKLANKEQIQGCQRFLKDLENKAYDFNPKDAEFVIGIIEKTFVHAQGERIDGTPLRGQPFLLEPFHKFQIYGKEKTAAYCELNAFKYRMRMGEKPEQPIDRDLEKEKWYINKANELRK